MVEIRPIRSEHDYEEALKSARKVWGSALGTPEGDQLDVLVTLIEAYEDEHYPMNRPSPEAIEAFRQEQAASLDAPAHMIFEIFRDVSGQFAFRVKGQADQVLLTSKSFAQKSDAIDAIRLLQASASQSEIIDFAA